MNPQITEELGRIPRGSLPQNPYRSAFVQARQNAGRDPEVGPEPADAHTVALAAVRQTYPDFTPDLQEEG
jgi:cation transport regulator ChaB